MFLAGLPQPRARAARTTARCSRCPPARLAFTTDSFVVSPLFFPGGDIGSLAVHGTVNDLAMCGARPLALTAGFILEEGLPMDDLWRIVRSMAQAARGRGRAASSPATPRSWTAARATACSSTPPASAWCPTGVRHRARRARGPATWCCSAARIADHGIAIMSVREGLAFETTHRERLRAAARAGRRAARRAGERRPRAARPDARRRWPARSTRSPRPRGVGHRARGDARSRCASRCAAPARSSGSTRSTSPTRASAWRSSRREAADAGARRACAPIRSGREAAVIGEVVADHPGQVMLRSRIGGTRVVDMLSGEQLPRIC